MTTRRIRRLIQALFVVPAMTATVLIGVHVIGNPVDVLISLQADQAEHARVVSTAGAPALRETVPGQRSACHLHNA